jgi:hypothetical protein
MLSFSCDNAGGDNMIEFVTVENMNRFPENALAAQHRLRYRSIIERQKWNVPNYGQMEFDQYDNPAEKYLIYRDENKARAAWLPVSQAVLANVRRTTGIHETIVDFGDSNEAAAAA